MCGLTDKLTIDTLGDPEDWFIECERCRIGTHAIFRGREATITAWNTRPLESANERDIRLRNAALRESEWVTYVDSDDGPVTFCPECRNDVMQGHDAKCKISAALAEAK